MFIVQRSCPSKVTSRSSDRQKQPSLSLAAIAAVTAAALAGCSADITRFDNPSFALSDGSTAPPVLAPSPNARRAQTNVFDDGPQPITSQRPSAGGAVVAALPDPPPAATVAPASVSQQPAVAPIAASVPPRAPVALAPPQPVAKGAVIEVQQGDTLYGIAKRHNVLISELMSANDLKSPAIKPGQKLHLPATSGKRAPVPKAPATAVAAHPAVATPAPAAAPGEWTGSYTLKQGDSLYAVAHSYGVKVHELQRINAIADATKLRAGTVLKVPAAKGQQTASATPASALAAPPPAAAAPAAPQAQAIPVSAPRTDVTIINPTRPETPSAAERIVEATAEPSKPVVKASAPSPAPASGKLRWPVQGRIVQPFGPRADGTHSDGVDVAVPAGTDVLAAEAGIVAYAGSEVKSYGNLVLIRHDNGWVTAYAYNEQILVQPGERVKRGQAIAKAGRTGSAEQPQLHFEVRVGAKPVDPVPYLEKL